MQNEGGRGGPLPLVARASAGIFQRGGRQVGTFLPFLSFSSFFSFFLSFSLSKVGQRKSQGGTAPSPPADAHGR